MQPSGLGQNLHQYYSKPNALSKPADDDLVNDVDEVADDDARDDEEDLDVDSQLENTGDDLSLSNKPQKIKKSNARNQL